MVLTYDMMFSNSDHSLMDIQPLIEHIHEIQENENATRRRANMEYCIHKTAFYSLIFILISSVVFIIYYLIFM
jgi:uncharacterized membrane protein YukC